MITTDRLQDLARRKGCEVVKATMRSCWRLIAPDGSVVRKADGSAGFTTNEAWRLLVRLPNAVYAEA